MSDQFNPLRSIIEGAREENEDLFGGLDPKLKQSLELKQERDEEKARTIALAWARFYESADGKIALDAMFDQTMRRTVFFAHLGMDPAMVGMFGAFREGQNHLSLEIARQIAIGLEAQKPKPSEAGQ